MTSPGERAQSFGAWADEYARLRPGYPPRLVDAVLRESVRALALPVVDIGAGTGLLTGTIKRLGYHVIAVEPDDRMRALIESGHLADSALPGSAEDMPLPDGSAAAVVGGQMWHWVNPEQALPEVARVLAPGGTMTILWILRDDTVPWVAEMLEEVELPDQLTRFADDAVPPLGAPFSAFALAQESFVQSIPTAEFGRHLSTYSTVALAEDAPERIAAAVTVVSRHFPDAAEIGMPFVCKAFTAVRA